MNALKFIPILSMTLISVCFTSCQKDMNPFEKVGNEVYPLNMVPNLSIPQQMEYESDEMSSTIKLPGNFIFGSFSDRTGIISTSCENNTLTYSFDENGGYTRDMEFYINIVGKEKLTLNHILFEGYGRFRYPVHIRQTGKKGMRIMTDNDIENWFVNGYKPTKDYLIGEIVAIGNSYAYPGPSSAAEPFIRDEEIVDFSNIECKDITVKTSEGTNVKIRIQELKRDGMVETFRGKVGDVTSIWLGRALYSTSFQGITNINVLDVYFN